MPTGSDGQLLFTEIRKAGLGDAIPAGVEAMDFSKEDVQEMCSLAFISVSNAVLMFMKRQKVTLEESDRWGKLTRIIYWKHLQKMEAGVLIHILFTAGILMSKPKLPEAQGGKKDGDKNS